MSDTKEFTIAEVRQLAHRTQQELSGLNGDPSRKANWVRERQLAAIVIALVERIDGLGYSVLVKP